MRPLALAALFALTTAGCIATARPVGGPDGGRWYAVECKRSRSNCYEKAAEVCPYGYRVADASEDSPGAMVFSGGYGPTTMLMAYRGELLIKCTYAEPKPEPMVGRVTTRPGYTVTSAPSPAPTGDPDGIEDDAPSVPLQRRR